MYANLKVALRTNSDPATDEDLSAYDVHIIGPTATVFLDDPDAEGHEPAGTHIVDLTTTTMKIEANF